MHDDILIKVINLPHRQDRREECLEEANIAGLSISPKSFFEARYLEHDGRQGCALSHAKALSDFLYDEDHPFVLILEDDFALRDAKEFSATLNMACQYAENWDVYLLGHNQALPIENTPITKNFRVINSQTTSGYIVGRNFTPKLIENFFRSANALRRYNSLNEQLRDHARHFFACDILWKELQTQNRFWAPFPSLIYQRESFSDIENRNTNYGV